jgi:hypothetical protein
MVVFKSPGVWTKEFHTSTISIHKRYLRKIKIGKIFGIDVSNITINPTPKVINYYD